MSEDVNELFAYEVGGVLFKNLTDKTLHISPNANTSKNINLKIKAFKSISSMQLNCIHTTIIKISEDHTCPDVH